MPSADESGYQNMTPVTGKKCCNKGFSLVELIVAILLISLIGVAMFSRFSSPTAFDASIARDNAIALALQAQQAALGRDNVSFEIDPSGGNWVLSVAVSGSVLRSVTIPGGSISLETGSTTSGTCALALDQVVTSNFRVVYDGSGNVTGFSNSTSSPEPVENGVRICVNDDTNYSACISPAGFAYQGDCDD